MITSIKNPKIQLVRQLLSAKKHRDAENLMVLEGVRLSEEALASSVAIKQCFFSENLSERGMDLLSQLSSRGIPTEELAPELMDRISDTQTSQGILLLCVLPEIAFPRDAGVVVVLDQVRDPGNMGTIMRTAQGLGVDGILLTPGSTDPFAPKALRAGLGAQLRLPLNWMTPQQLNDFCRDSAHPVRILTTTMDCEKTCWEADLSGPVCVVIGSEAHGVSDEILQISDGCVRIPIASDLESYNAAIAAGILMYEVIRQRKRK